MLRGCVDAAFVVMPVIWQKLAPGRFLQLVERYVLLALLVLLKIFPRFLDQFWVRQKINSCGGHDLNRVDGGLMTDAHAVAGGAAVNYRFEKFDLSLGYRYLDWDLGSDFEPADDLNVKGVYVGAKFDF